MISRRAFLGAAAGVTFLSGIMESEGSPGSATLRRRVPSSGEFVPAVGLGTWQAFHSAERSEDRRRLTEVLTTMYALGGRVIDTSPMYANAEAVLGRLLPRHDDWFVATKVWTTGRESGRRQMQDSLAHLKRDRIALMQIHNLVDWRTHVPTLRAWKSEGRFRYLGVTHYVTSAFDSLETVLRGGGFDFVQLPYSPALPDAARRLIPAARDLGVAIIVNRPFEGGDLFRTLRGRPLPDFVRPFAQSWAQVFLKYILADAAVTCVIPGTGNPKHVRDNMGAMVGRLPDGAERKRLEILVRGL